jgi:hypothetical protein
MFLNVKNVSSSLRHSLLGNEDSVSSHLETILFHDLLGLPVLVIAELASIGQGDVLVDSRQMCRSSFDILASITDVRDTCFTQRCLSTLQCKAATSQADHRQGAHSHEVVTIMIRPSQSFLSHRPSVLNALVKRDMSTSGEDVLPARVFV